MYSSLLLELTGTQGILLSNTQRKHNFCLFWRKLQRASLSSSERDSISDLFSVTERRGCGSLRSGLEPVCVGLRGISS